MESSDNTSRIDKSIVIVETKETTTEYGVRLATTEEKARRRRNEEYRKKLRESQNK